jgi:hypothetical protein
MEIDLTSAVGHLFHHNPTYSDLDIARRITEDYNIEHLTFTARFVKRIRLEQGWLRRHNNPAAAEMQEASTIDAIEQLLEEGRVRQYGRRQLMTHLARKHGHRSRHNDVLTALRILDDYGVISRTPGMKKKRRDNYVVPGPDWLWCLDGHDKLARFGIEIYGCVDAYSRKIIWFFVGSSNRTQVSVLRQYLHTVKTVGYCPNLIRSDKGRETPMMADAHYFFYHTACFNDPTIPDEVFNQICFNDCYIYGKSTGNTRIEGLWYQMISRTTEQWILFFSALEADGWFREDLISDQVILVFIFMPILQDVIGDWVEDHNAAPIRPQRHRSLHVPGIPNDLYRGSPNAPKQGFDFDRDLHSELERQVLDYSTSFPYSSKKSVRLRSRVLTSRRA